jgi:hypothetical protein
VEFDRESGREYPSEPVKTFKIIALYLLFFFGLLILALVLYPNSTAETGCEPPDAACN